MDPKVLFWSIIVLGQAPYYNVIRLTRAGPGNIFVARSRRATLIRALDGVVIVGYAVVALLTDWRLPLTPFPKATAWAGVAAALAGVLVTGWGKIHLGRYFSATFAVKQNHELITTGPFALVRHPIYAGLLLEFTGGALVYNSALAVAMLVAPMAALLYWHTVEEEKLLVSHFGESYRRYRERTGRFFPGGHLWGS